MLEFLTQSAWADRIGWMLVHTLWQFALVTVVAVGLHRALHRCQAVTRYRALMVVMGLMLAVASTFAQDKKPKDQHYLTYRQKLMAGIGANMGARGVSLKIWPRVCPPATAGHSSPPCGGWLSPMATC